MRTQVGIIGSGPAGLLLSRILAQHGIESVLLERQSRAYVEARIRAGVLEQGTVNMLRDCGVHERMDREGIPHEGFALAFSGRSARIDMAGHTGGQSVMVYGQTEVTKDLIEARLAEGGILKYECPAVAVEDFGSDKPRIIYEEAGQQKVLRCDF
ncbi:MAG: FAD-dependent monooxygenase, partial [Anaerolineales bacterium]|nr:FAD-dependent monooxygenase [Anaerolineales bacterium]